MSGNKLMTAAQAAKEMAESFNLMADEEGLTPEDRAEVLNAFAASMFTFSGFPPAVSGRKIEPGEVFQFYGDSNG